MKPILFFIFLTLFCIKASSQTLSIDEVTGMLAKQDTAFLGSKDFLLCKNCISEGPPYPATYIKHKGAADKEQIDLYPHLVQYFLNIPALTNVLNQAKANYKLVKSEYVGGQVREDENFTHSIFSNGKINLSFMIFKKSGWIEVLAEK